MRDHDLRKNILEFPRVLCACEELVSASLGEECVSVDVPVILLDENNELKKYKSYSICRKIEEEDAKIILKRLNGLTKEKFIEKNPYCHICTYPEDEKHYFISFDKSDDIPCKAEFSDGYNYLDYFFYKFNNMRNKLIDEKSPVELDDLDQYLYIVLYDSNKKEKKDNILQKVKKRIMN